MHLYSLKVCETMARGRLCCSCHTRLPNTVVMKKLSETRGRETLLARYRILFPRCCPALYVLCPKGGYRSSPTLAPVCMYAHTQTDPPTQTSTKKRPSGEVGKSCVSNRDVRIRFLHIFSVAPSRFGLSSEFIF